MNITLLCNSCTRFCEFCADFLTSYSLLLDFKTLGVTCNGFLFLLVSISIFTFFIITGNPFFLGFKISSLISGVTYFFAASLTNMFMVSFLPERNSVLSLNTPLYLFLVDYGITGLLMDVK